jgi:hypothetical protein
MGETKQRMGTIDENGELKMGTIDELIGVPVVPVDQLRIYTTSASLDSPKEVRVILVGKGLPAAMEIVLDCREGAEAVLQSLREHIADAWGDGAGDRPRHQEHRRGK